MTLVPIFFGQGGHIREDLPKLLAACSQKYPQMDLTVKPAVGEDLGVLQAIAKYCTDQ
jgi:sirohydrochlorin cobaltochelatase